jgi:hypothetical protein
VGVVVVTDPGTVVTDPGTVVTGKEIERCHLLPALVGNETPALLAPNPFRFLVRAVTVNFLFAGTFFTLHRVAVFNATQIELPTFTSVNNKGDFLFVIALVNTTVTSTFPALLLFTATMLEIEGFDGLAFNEYAEA